MNRNLQQVNIVVRFVAQQSTIISKTQGMDVVVITANQLLMKAL